MNGGNGKRLLKRSKPLAEPRRVPRHTKRTKLETLVDDVLKVIGKVKTVDKKWFCYQLGVWKEVKRSRFEPIALEVQTPDERNPKTTNTILDWIGQAGQVDVTDFFGVTKWENEPWKVLLINCANCVVKVNMESGEISQLAHDSD